MITEEELLEWCALSKELERIKAKEMMLRKKIVDEVIPISATKNTAKKELFGVPLHATRKTSLYVDQNNLDTLYKEFNDNETKAFKWRASAVAKAYNTLPVDSIARSVVTLKDAAPTLSLIFED